MTRLWHLSTTLLHRWAAVLIPLSLLLSAAASLGAWVALHDVAQEADDRCAGIIHGFELLGEELDAPAGRVDRFVARFEADTDC